MTRRRLRTDPVLVSNWRPQLVVPYTKKRLYGCWSGNIERHCIVLFSFALLQSICTSEPPIWGRQKGVTPICSDFPVFFRFVPICAPCFREYPDFFRFVPICSVFFRFVPICFQNKSEQIRKTPFCRPLLQSICPYRVQTADFDSLTDRLCYNQPWVTGLGSL